MLNILVFWVLAAPNRPVDPVPVFPKRPVPVCDGVAVPNPVVAVVFAPKRLPPVPKPVINLNLKLQFIHNHKIHPKIILCIAWFQSHDTFNPLTFTVRYIGHHENKRTKDGTKQE